MITAKNRVLAPDFTMVDADGKQIHLTEYRGKNIVLVFNRGFSWPYCRRHMAQLRQEYQKFVELNAEVIAIGPEDAQSFANWWHKEKMPFTGIPDPKHHIASVYGQQVKLLKLGRMPAMIVIDKSGYIRYHHFGESMSDIPEDEEVLSLLDDLNKETNWHCVSS